MGPTRTGVASDHARWMLEELADRYLVVGVVPYIAEAQVLRQQKVTESVERILPQDVGYLVKIHSVEFPVGRFLESGHVPALRDSPAALPRVGLLPHAPSSRRVGQPLQEGIGTTLLDPVGKSDRGAAAAVVVGVGVEGDGETVIAGAVHHLEERPELTVDAPPAGIVGNVQRHTGPSCDVDHLHERIAEHVTEAVANVRDVDAPDLLRHRRQLLELPGRCVGTGRVREPGRHAESALFHSLPKQAAHTIHLASGRWAIVPSHRRHAQRGVAEDVGDVYRHVLVVHAEVLVDRGPAHSLRASPHRGRR